MIVVLDASAAIEVVLKRDASMVLRKAIEDADYIATPDLYVAEVSNALWKYASLASEELPPAGLLDDALALPDEYVSARELCREAFAFSVQHRHPVYDSLYAVLARRHSAVLLTVDRRLGALAKSEGLTVIPGNS